MSPGSRNFDAGYPAALSAERIRATALAKRYGGSSEVLTLAEASALHPNRTITPADLADTSKFRYRKNRRPPQTG